MRAHFKYDFRCSFDDLEFLLIIHMNAGLPFVFGVKRDLEYFIIFASIRLGVLYGVTESKKGGF